MMVLPTKGAGSATTPNVAGGSAGAPNEAPLAIEITALSKVYARGDGTSLRAVDDLSLSVPAGQVVAFLGPNGAGKTTTIKMMGGLVTPTSGRARLNGWDVGRERAMAVRQIGAVLEGARNVYWALTAWQNLLYFGRLKGLSRSSIAPRADQLLRSLDLWERRNQTVGELSRGMQQKVAIAAALIADPPILLLDEPTLGLDVQTARIVKDWLVRIAHEQGKTILLTTHQLALAQEVSDRVAIINHGHLLADLPVRELLKRFSQDLYEIRLGGPLDPTNGVGGWLDGFAVTSAERESRIRGPIPDQARLYDVIEQLRARHLPLIAVEPVEPSLEDVFFQLLQEA
jgi:ABC-2 type transport system ATP-binding protein